MGGRFLGSRERAAHTRGVLLLAGFVGSLAGGVLGPVLLGVLAFSRGLLPSAGPDGNPG